MDLGVGLGNSSLTNVDRGTSAKQYKKGLRFGRSLPTPIQAWHEFIKVRICVAAVTTILTYGGEIWNTTDKQIIRRETLHQYCLRRILRIRWFHRVENEEVLRRATRKPIRDLICNKRMSWFGHVVRMPAEVNGYQDIFLNGSSNMGNDPD
ncbi:uncharacterized protein [Montipora foliosa]|uniref:uncharacterized protein n=1 Tax=Montipora foliosa TaxID=591990 RepID=UPI0035F1CAB5